MGCHYSIGAWKKKKKINKFISKAYKIKTTGMYIVNKHYYDTLLNNFKYSVNYMEKCKKNKKKINYRTWAIDKYWMRLQKKNNWFIFNKNLGYQKPGYSDIQNKNKNYIKILS